MQASPDDPDAVISLDETRVVRLLVRCLFFSAKGDGFISEQQVRESVERHNQVYAQVAGRSLSAQAPDGSPERNSDEMEEKEDDNDDDDERKEGVEESGNPVAPLSVVVGADGTPQAPSAKRRRPVSQSDPDFDTNAKPTTLNFGLASSSAVSTSEKVAGPASLVKAAGPATLEWLSLDRIQAAVSLSLPSCERFAAIDPSFIGW